MTVPTNPGDLSDEEVAPATLADPTTQAVSYLDAVRLTLRSQQIRLEKAERELADERRRSEAASITGAGREEIAQQFIDICGLAPGENVIDVAEAADHAAGIALAREAAVVVRTIKRCAKIASIVEPTGNPVTEDYEDGRGDAADAIRALLADPAPGGEKEAG